MPKRIEFQELAVLRLDEANILLTQNYPDGAFYLAGYAVECALKSAICKTLNIDDFFDTYSSKAHGAKVKDDIVQKFKTHDYGTLLVLSGLYFKLETAITADIPLGDAWTIIRTLSWTEQYRYETSVRKEQAAVQSFIDSVNIFLQWIRPHW
ncbi:hypothetical protein [Spirosoma validum]|uniref:HEPN domain-containing protein n=1 Tax=Spirosoma validum TaxID=2771355 RepID=A0A927GG17_9BACT|nr:hypothetical protein [Spirosoma validum]MBD2756401.1 hypothetical protein [Spirosoma validum]